MNLTLLRFRFALLLLLLPTLALARDKSARRKGLAAATPTAVARATPAADAQPLSAELTKLQFLVGDWVHQELDHQGAIGTAVKRSARSKTSWIHNNQHLYVLYKSKAADSEYEARAFIAWDGTARQYRLDWFDSGGQGLRYTGSFGPDGVLVFEAPLPGGGRESIKVKKQTDGKILLLQERAAGDGPAALYVESLAQTAPPVPPVEAIPCGVPPRPDPRATPSARSTALTKPTTTPRPTATKTP